MDQLETFFKKNMIWFFVIVSLLFCFKSIQSCNRDNKIIKLEKQNVYNIDSLNKIIANKNVKIIELSLELKSAGDMLDMANQRANSIQSTAEKITKNTTVKITKE